MTDSAPPAARPAATTSTAVLPPELEARVAAFEHAARGPDFGKAGWFWMMLLGVALPLLLLVIGWWA